MSSPLQSVLVCNILHIANTNSCFDNNWCLVREWEKTSSPKMVGDLGSAFPLGYHTMPLQQNLCCKSFCLAGSGHQSAYPLGSPAEMWAPTHLSTHQGTARFNAPVKCWQSTARGVWSEWLLQPHVGVLHLPAHICGSPQARGSWLWDAGMLLPARELHPPFGLKSSQCSCP